jgi:hypothetical protein
MEWFFICLAWWIGIGLLAAHKRRGIIRWMFMGLLFLLPATIILALLPPARMRNCLYCAERMKQEANVCKHCGRPQYVESVAVGPYGPQGPQSPHYLP